MLKMPRNGFLLHVNNRCWMSASMRCVCFQIATKMINRCGAKLYKKGINDLEALSDTREFTTILFGATKYKISSFPKFRGEIFLAMV